MRLVQPDAPAAGAGAALPAPAVAGGCCACEGGAGAAPGRGVAGAGSCAVGVSGGAAADSPVGDATTDQAAVCKRCCVHAGGKCRKAVQADAVAKCSLFGELRNWNDDKAKRLISS